MCGIDHSIELKSLGGDLTFAALCMKVRIGLAATPKQKGGIKIFLLDCVGASPKGADWLRTPLQIYGHDFLLLFLE